MDILSDPGEMSDKSTDPAYRAVKVICVIY